ncbi:hypothetical protein [Niallia sp. 03190]|uniref:hypothetical protein n=1 Tax=Niallia sp. 03190 TaxID=3458061 RepID=UPI004044CA7A
MGDESPSFFSLKEDITGTLVLVLVKYSYQKKEVKQMPTITIKLPLFHQQK